MDVDAIRTWSRRQLGCAAGGVVAAALTLPFVKHASATESGRNEQWQPDGWQQGTTEDIVQSTPYGEESYASTQPNIVMILLDDLRWSDYWVMSRTQSLMADAGTTFPNYFVTTPSCAPSRASFFRGQYAHNHKVEYGDSGETAWALYHNTGLDQDTIVVWLHEVGYRTAQIGKHMNQVKLRGAAGPGWDEWVVPRRLTPFNYDLSVNGHIESHGDAEEDYLTDVLAQKAVEFIASTPEETPLFLYFATKAPHKPAVPAPRHVGRFADIDLDQSGSFNEADLGDKPINMQRPTLTPGEITWLNKLNRDRLESLLAVDEAVEQIVTALDEAGRLENTYVVLTSDNGYALGEHRDEAKSTPYDEAIRVGMLARGPQIPAGHVNPALVANIDLAPTFAEIAGAPVPSFVDGRSILAALQGGDSGRKSLLIEVDSPLGQDVEEDEEAVIHHVDENRIAGRIRSSWRGIRTDEWLYAEWGVPPVDYELYDVTKDPFQLQSLHAGPDYAEVREELSTWLESLVDCAGATCRQAESAPPR